MGLSDTDSLSRKLGCAPKHRVTPGRRCGLEGKLSTWRRLGVPSGHSDRAAGDSASGS